MTRAHAISAAKSESRTTVTMIRSRREAASVVRSFVRKALSGPFGMRVSIPQASIAMPKKSTNDMNGFTKIAIYEPAEEARIRMQMIRQAAPRPNLRCRTTTAYGVTETRCF